MLALSVAVLLSIDIIILVTYTLVEGVRGNLSASLLSNEENKKSLFGVSTTKGYMQSHDTACTTSSLARQTLLPKEGERVW